MKLLRETIRRLIFESACDLVNDKIFHAIEEIVYQGLTVHSRIRSNSLAVEIYNYGPNGEILVGFLEAEKPSDSLGNCLGAFIVTETHVEVPYRGNSGFGALLYDVALELVGEQGLAADRRNVSSDAVRIWNYFLNSPDYIKKSLDNFDGEYTPNRKEDDCEAVSFLKHGGSKTDSKEEFQNHALNNVIIKKNTSRNTINCLTDRGVYQ